MRYAQMRKYDIANGTGVRTSLFVSGCTHNCEGCFNKEYQDFTYGIKWTNEVENEFMQYVLDDNVRGATILGGEPMQQVQDDDLLNLLKRVRTESGKTVWLYSGYTFEEIVEDNKRRKLIEQVDVLVDGRFVEELKDIRLQFRGSSNQRIIDVQKSLQNKEVILLKG
jgi:anaerobic ribonucleoside-triphosphate reductase activating protein